MSFFYFCVVSHPPVHPPLSKKVGMWEIEEMKRQLKLYITYIILSLSWVWGDCEEGEVELWSECYSIENTTDLDLSYGGLTGEIPPEIGNLTNLISLILKENQLIGEIPSEISYLTSLTILDLGGNLLTGEIPSEISYLTSLTILDLGGNLLTGEISPEIGILTNLTDLELGGNLLTGEIPSEIDNLVNLTFLHLEYNQITGEIPPEIGNLTTLIWLNFVNNQLTGEIPSSICNLDMNWSNPDNFNIYYNQLCPPYPSCVEDYVGEQDTTNCGQGNIIVDYQSDWNLVGLPLDVEDASYSILFPESIEGTLYSFNGGYNLATILTHGEGYWLRFAIDGSTTITGNVINELTISLSEGWNLISGISTLINISDIQDPDAIIISGTVYGFTSGVYSNTENIEPGRGYWVRANSLGYIFFIGNPGLLPEECYLEPDVGPCDGVCPRYFYNQETEECEEFSWGCCEGLVPFDTLEECISACE